MDPHTQNLYHPEFFQDDNLHSDVPFQEDVREASREADVNQSTLNFINEITEKLYNEDMIAQIIEKSESLSDENKRLLGDKIIELIDQCNIKFLSVIIPGEDEDGYIVRLFPAHIYRESLVTLADTLTRQCDCPDPKESHQHYRVDVDYEYSLLDCWFLNCCYDNILSRPQRIRELSSQLKCPYELLNNEDNRIEIMDWIDTDESLGWSDPPERRKHFIETGKFVDFKLEFEKDADVHELFEQYVKYVESETNERTKIKFLNCSEPMLEKFGTSDGYFEFSIGTPDYHFTKYLIPYGTNKESIEMFKTAIADENIGHQHNKFGMCCRCGNAYNVHRSLIRNNLHSKAKVNGFLGIDSNGNKFPYHNPDYDIKLYDTMVPTLTLSSMLETCCPYSLLEFDKIGNLFLS